MIGPSKKVAFAVAANLIGITIVVSVAEFAMRWRVEKGFRGAWRSFSSGAPFSDVGAENWVVADPDLGYRLNPAKPGINSFGIRNPDIPLSKRRGVVRVIVLGDSVAAPSNGFVHLLGERLKDRVEIINAAIPGYTTYQERRLLEKYLLPTQPDLVILQYCLNDNHQFLHKFDAKGQMLMTEEAERALLPGKGGLLSYLTRHSYLAARVRLAQLQLKTARADYPWQNRPDVSVAWQDESWKTFEEHLRAMRLELQRIGARLVVVMAPLRPQFEPKVLAYGPSFVMKPQTKMAEICAAEGVPLLDLYPFLARHGGKDLFYDDYHFNAGGHQVTADALLVFLKRNGLIKLR